MESLRVSGDIAGKCQNKCCKRTLFDVVIHARRIEEMVVSLRGRQLSKSESTRACRSASLVREAVVPLRMAQ
jgi:hypothetical protein